jgi:ribosomal protein S18 acetylase RimI-like enzyme
MGFSIAPVGGPCDLDTVRRLFREYADGLGIDLAYQGFDEELAQLPGRYAPPAGGLLLALGDSGAVLGRVGLRPLKRVEVCELKRLYVRPAARGAGLGLALARSAVERAAAIGYREIVLDTLPSMTPAIAVYRALGFEPIPPIPMLSFRAFSISASDCRRVEPHHTPYRSVSRAPCVLRGLALRGTSG